eukprot:TRINITY_DN4938_c0_g1_i1.p1 TRINITY_DN4938_c0_g1~~TRINITY_DN4938_c0_g1_i1.p1  ORF type:complete len:411 (+),score=73.94 TRINITY_DN4938_c0_g1_i1:170-1234(+)
MTGCPCEDTSLCKQIQGRRSKEVFGFSTPDSNYQWGVLDWSRITTIAWATGDAAMCTAHKNNARIIAGAIELTTYNLTMMTQNPALIDQYVADTVSMVKAQYLDGVTFDYESPLAPHSLEAETYVRVINATKTALESQVPGTQVSVCVAWSPFNIDGRYYDILGFAGVVDYMYVMMYDTRSQIFEQCIAAPNAALPIVYQGVQQYLALGVPPQKIILGLPWYGYDYPCTNDAPDQEFCKLRLVPFRGVNCSDAAGTEMPFSWYMNLLNTNQTTTGLQWNADVSSPWFNYKDANGVVHQMQIDTSESLRNKYEVAAKYGLGGTGPYCFTMLAYGTQQEQDQARAMWEALDVFIKA